MLLDGLSNIWYASMLLKKDHFGIHAIETDARPSQRGSDCVVHSHASDPLIKVKYAQYEKQYHVLKGQKNRDKVTNKTRKHIERWMRYWRIKMRFLNCGNAPHQKRYRESLYTMIFDYGGGDIL